MTSKYQLKQRLRRIVSLKFGALALKPEEYEYHFNEQELYRRRHIQLGAWTDLDERNYIAAVKRKNRENYRGWWRLENLPYGQTHETWFSGLLDEPSDPSKSIIEIGRILQLHTYIDWQHQSIDEVIFLDAYGVEEELSYWRNERVAGRSGYGDD